MTGGGRLKLGGWVSQDFVGHGSLLSPKDRVAGPLTNGHEAMASKWG